MRTLAKMSLAVACVAFFYPGPGASLFAQTASTRALGTIKSISSASLVLTTDAGAEITVNVDASTKFLRISPGEKDLKNAEPISLADLQPGDRILVRGAASADGKSLSALSIIAMKQRSEERR